MALEDINSEYTNYEEMREGVGIVRIHTGYAYPATQDAEHPVQPGERVGALEFTPVFFKHADNRVKSTLKGYVVTFDNKELHDVILAKSVASQTDVPGFFLFQG